MSFLDITAKARRVVHSNFAVPCVLTQTHGSFPVSARFHDKMALSGDLAGQGYAGIIEGVTHVVFNREELQTLGVTPLRGDGLAFANFFGAGQVLTVQLDARTPYDGPIDEKWTVAVL